MTVSPLWLFLAVLWVGLHGMIVAFPYYTQNKQNQKKKPNRGTSTDVSKMYNNRTMLFSLKQVKK